MLLKPSTRRFGCWLAILAMALNALWPLLAQAKPTQAGASLIEICTATGMKSIADNGGEHQPAHKNLAPHCEFCSLDADRAPLPPSYAIMPIQTSTTVAVIAAGESAPTVSQPCVSPALPRAPPVFS